MELKINSLAEYERRYNLAKNNPKEFWDNIAKNFNWFQKWNKTYASDFGKADTKWFLNGKTNLATNCLDRHLVTKANDIAIIWESNDVNTESKRLTYKELHAKTCQFANLLKQKGIEKGDRVCLYMPMIPEAVIAMLACARIGAVHSVVFAGFSATALADRIKNCEAKIVITSDRLFRGDKTLNLLDIVNDALEQDCNTVTDVITYKRSSDNLKSKANLSIWQEEVINCKSECRAEELDSEDPLFILYTSGSTGKPKGVLHSTAGYMVYAAYSFQNVFQYEENDIFFCTADVGWITGHTYLTYGPLLSGATILMFEGVPTYPTPSRFWEIIEKHQVNIFYTAPTAIRALMLKGDQYVDNFDMSSLKTLGTVGEPINKEAWEWYNEKVGKNKCPIVDTWWQTETGGILISPLAGLTKTTPTYATKPLPGIEPILLDNNGQEVTEANVQGNLCFKQPWPSIIRSTWGDHNRCIETYFSQFPGYYFSGDGAFKSEQGDFRIIGRVDDVINVSGHRIGTAEIENAINMHEKITESAVIGFPHEVKGEGIHAFVIAKLNEENLEQEILHLVNQQIGAIAKPDKITIVPDLPKTRSGKIMRRILRKIAANENDLGDTSTLVNPEIVEKLKETA